MKTQTTKHTPGPWNYVLGGNVADSTGTAVVAKVYGAKDSPLNWISDYDSNEYLANARLIAAAPDTYAVCKMLIEGKVSYQELLTSAISAIARAEGGEG